MAVRVVVTPEYRARLDVAVTEMLAKLASAIELDAARAVPVRTGELRDSIHAEPATPRSVIVRAGAKHAAYVELGTRYMAAQPYLKPALYRTRAV